MTTNNIPPEIPRDLLGGIIDQVFGGAIEDTTVIEYIYRVIACEFQPATPNRDAVDLAREGMELYQPGQPEHIVCRELVRIAESSQGAMPADEWLKEHERLVLAYKDAVFDTTGFFLDNRRAAFDSVMAHARRRIEGERK